MSLVSYPRPEVGRWFVRRAFRKWPGRRRRWLDLVSGTIRQDSPGVDLPTAKGLRPLPDLLYLPPVEPGVEEARGEMIRNLAESGAAVLVQCSPQGPFPPATPGVSVVVDVLEDLLSESLDGLGPLPSGCAVAWPLLGGISDGPELLDRVFAHFAEEGVSCVQAVTPSFSARDRQQLVAERGGGDEFFDSLFHRRPASERDLAAVAVRHGLGSFFLRPSRAASRHERNLELAETLALAGEVWLRLGRSEVGGQALFRASRWAAETPVEVRAVALEGNLGVVDWVAGEVTELIVEWASTGGSKQLEEWLGEYAEGGE